MEKLLFFTLLSANYIFFKKHNKQMSKKDHFLKELSWKTVKKTACKMVIFIYE